MKKWGCYMLVVPWQEAGKGLLVTEQRVEVFDYKGSADRFAEDVFKHGLSPRVGTILRVMSVMVGEIE